jgi:PKD repeat protein
MNQFYKVFSKKWTFLLFSFFLSGSLFAQLSGTYTIDKNSAASSTNYQSFSSLFKDLNSGSRTDAGTANGPGVSAAVVVNVIKSSGPYTEQVNITAINGVSSKANITINGNGEVVQYTATSSSSSYVFRLNGTDFVTFDGLTVKALGSSYGRCFHFMNSADNNAIQNCDLQMPNMTSTSNYNAYVSITQGTTSPTSYGDPGEDISIIKNNMHSGSNKGPYTGIMVVNERSGTIVHNYNIENNNIQDWSYAGIYAYYLMEANIKNNEIHNTGSSISGYKYGLYMYNYFKGGNHNLIGNHFHDFTTASNSYFYGIYNYAYYGTGDNGVNISDNKFEFYNRNYYTYAIRNYCYRASIKGVCQLNNNEIDIEYNSSSYYTQYGIYNYMYYASGFDNFEVNKNKVKIQSERYAYGIYNYGYYASFSKASHIANNILNLQSNYYTYGLYNYLRFVTTKVVCAFNTIYTSAYGTGTSSGNKYMMYAYYADNMEIKNNVLFSADNGGTTYGMYTYQGNLDIDNNNLYLNNATSTVHYGYDGTNQSTFDDFKTNMGGKKDINLDPRFLDITKDDFSPTSFKMVNKGVPVATITDDVNGTIRNTTNPDLGAVEYYIDVAAKHFSFKGANECGNYKEKVTVTIKNNNAIDIEDIPMAFDINGLVKVSEIVDVKIAAGDSLEFTFEKPAKFNFPGDNTLTVYLNGSDDNASNNSQEADVFIVSAPYGGFVNETTSFPGYFRQGASGGLVSNPDVTIPGLEIEYEINNPAGYSNSDYGTGTGFTMTNHVITTGGLMVTNGVTYTAPSGSNKGLLSFKPDLNLQDSTVFVGIKATSATTGCDTFFGRYVYIPHVPKVDYDAADPCDGDVIEFKNLTTLAKGNQLYDWQFNDPNSDDDATDVGDPIYKFTTYGSYDVDLNIRLAAYPKFVFTKTRTIKVTPVPAISFKVYNACENSPINIVNDTKLPAGVAGTITYTWNYGGAGTGDPVTTKSPKFTFAKAGGYQVTLTATSNGCTSTLTKNANQFANPEASFTKSGTCNLEEIDFTNSTTIALGNTGYTWDFGDNTISNLANPTHVFQTPGSKTVQLKAISEFGCESDATVTFNLAESPKADFTYSDACNLTQVEFKREGTIPTGVNSIYEWDFSGETTSTNENPKHLFNTLGFKDVTLIVRSANGCSDAITKSFPVKLQSKADFSAIDVCEGEEVIFTNQSAVAAGDLSYEWRFGNGGNSNKTSPKQLYNVNGSTKTYLVTLVANVLGGCSDSITKPVTVNAKSDASFSTSVSGRTVSFVPTTTDVNNSYNWRFGNGGRSNEITPTHVYENIDNGDFTACLAIINGSGCLSETCKSVTIDLVSVTDATLQKIKMYPNPSTGIVNIQLDSDNGEVSMKIADTKGSQLMSSTFNQAQNYQLDLSDFAEGVYYITLSNSNGTITNKITITK